MCVLAAAPRTKAAAPRGRGACPACNPSLQPHAPQAGIVAAGCLVLMALVFTPSNRERISLCACRALPLRALPLESAKAKASAKPTATAAAKAASLTWPSMTAVLPSRKGAALASAF